MAEVATTKLHEDEQIIVWEMVLNPGASTGVHTHRHDYVFHVLEGARLKITDARHELLFERDFVAGSLSAPRVDGNWLIDGDSRIPATHNATNTDTRRFREILIEKK